MTVLGQVEGFDWDQHNLLKSVDKHGVGIAEAEQVFFNEPLVIAADQKHSIDEARFHALGRSDLGRRLQVTFTLRLGGTLIHIISARAMSRREREFYERAEAGS
jgi:uncharacterized DUF497 family protein